MKNKILGISTALSLLSISISSATASSQPVNNIKGNQAPNVIMIVLDDVGFADLGAFGSEIKTPNIDNLAQQGLRYNRFDTASMCSPTRAALLTGRNPHTVNMAELPPKGAGHKVGGVEGVGASKPLGDQASKPLGAGPANSGEIPTNAQNIAQALQSSGYATYALGKWHVAPEYKDADERNREFWPLQRGFNYYYGFLSGHTSQYHPLLIENNVALPTPNKLGYHLSVDLVDRAMTVMDKKDSSKPKFVYLALGAGHSPLHVPKPYIDAYKGAYDQGWDKLRQERFVRQKKMGIIPENTVLPPREYGDAEWSSLDSQRKHVFARFMETYAGFLTHTDEQIGRLIDHLKSTGQYDNTLIMLISDNGAAPEGGQDGGFRFAYGDKTTVAEMDASLNEAGGPKTDMLYQRPWAYAGVTPLRRYKLWPFLGGIRTPFIASWPSHIKDKGAVRNQYVNVIDLAPTILEAVGSQFSEEINGVKQIPVAGKSILNTFTSKTAPTRDVQYFELRGNRAITQGKWRAVAMHKLGTDYAQDPWELFNVEADFSESKDLSKQYPEKLEELKKLWWAEANRYSNPPIVEPVELLYKFNHMDDAFSK
ncbi:arylsulfatase [Pectobacterium aquaticum]|uniref:Arylsulfatase n=1 Tax=Pectobacterium aquaticum TaxID=2204145 RepID=A0ABX9Z1R3_9GAMM|nr:arylsulfatase [Pectobacterium aquaticum]RRO04225.1 arylsulfatase [Pectobacterium aquaticum]RRO07312.1 arylsulfatase [Pectobacterium aquaticum]